MRFEGETVRKVYPTLARRQAGEGALVMDVRESDEIARGDFDPAEVVVTPMSELERHHGKHPHDRDLITDCAVRDLRLKATDLLMCTGHTRVANGEGGIAKWIR